LTVTSWREYEYLNFWHLSFQLEFQELNAEVDSVALVQSPGREGNLTEAAMEWAEPEFLEKFQKPTSVKSVHPWDIQTAELDRLDHCSLLSSITSKTDWMEQTTEIVAVANEAFSSIQGKINDLSSDLDKGRTPLRLSTD